MAVNFAIALAATLIFKLALFSYAASGAEGYTSALAWYPRLALCLGWDVVSAAIVGAIATAPALALRSRRPAAIASATVQAAYAIFLVISYHVAVIVGAPLDKAAIDLWFFYADPSVGGTARILSDSVAPYFTPALYVEAAAAVLLPIAAMAWLRRRTPPRLSPRGGGVLVTAVVLTVAGVPGLANGPLAVHTFGLERSPLTMLIGSYARAPLAMFRARGAAPADPFCFDASSPVPIGGTDPLKGVAPKRTNLVLVILESVGARSLQSEPQPMPFLQSMGRRRDAVTFLDHYAHWPQTMKAQFSLWCSELPDPDYPPITEINPAIPCVSISETLKQAGYDTALFTSADFAFARQIRFFRRRGLDVMLDRNELPGHERAWQNAWGIDERVTIAAAAEWLTRHQRDHPDRPFFLTYNMASGHHPFEFPGSPSGRWLDADKEAAALRRTLSWVDDRLRDVVGELQRQNLLDSTLVAIVSDHGPGSGRPMMGRVRDASIYEGSVRVPLIMFGPQLAGASGSVTLPTGHVDLAPTLLGLLGLQPPMTMKGRDLTRDAGERVVILATRPPLSQIGVRAGRWKLVHWSDTGANELFDLSADPDERDDLAGRHPDITRTLESIVQRWRVQSANLIPNYASILGASGHACSAPTEKSVARRRTSGA